MSSRWSERRRGGRLRFIEQQRDTRSANVFSRAPSIKGIFMQRAKVIRSLGMHIARASHGLPLLLSLSLSRGSRERENGLEPVLKGPARKVREVRPSVRLLSIHSTPPPHVSKSTRRFCHAKGYGIIVYVGHAQTSCRNEKSCRYAAILQPRRCLNLLETITQGLRFGKSTGPARYLWTGSVGTR